MYIKSLELKNFRNYRALYIRLVPGINVFYGENGTGKTNILEAVYYISMTRSFRVSEFIVWRSGIRNWKFITVFS